MPDTRNGAKSCNTATEQRKPPGVPFTKGDPRINRKGRPKSFDEARAMAQIIAHELKGGELAVERLLRSWRDSDEPFLQNKFFEVAFGKVPDKLDVTGLENKPQIFLAYAHERQSSGQN